ncbi:MAG: hypothetical protein Q8Q60_00470 [Candidatus Chromulinivorax sp.]|nr:hypothetical protein [Candidatus Chromulinivorax sp.]
MNNKLILWAIFSFTISASPSHCSSNNEVKKAFKKQLQALDTTTVKATTGPYDNAETIEIIRALTSIRQSLKSYPKLDHMQKSVQSDLREIKRMNSQKKPKSCWPCMISYSKRKVYPHEK